MRSVSFPLFLGLVLAACSKAGSDGGGETGDTTSPLFEIFFQSGFGPGVEAQDNGAGPCSADLTGSDGYDLSGTRKGRVQMALLAEENRPYTKKVDYSVPLRLGESFQTLNDSFPLQLEWMTIGEY